MKRFWLQTTMVISFLGAMLCVGIGTLTHNDVFAVAAFVLLIVTCVTGIAAGRCPHCGRWNRYGAFDNYCSRCGGSMDD